MPVSMTNELSKLTDVYEHRVPCPARSRKTAGLFALRAAVLGTQLGRLPTKRQRGGRATTVTGRPAMRRGGV